MELALDAEEWLRKERELLREARRGNRAAIAELYRAFAPRLYARVLMPKLGNPQAAEDALSETFRTALERLDQFDDKGVSIYFWLSRIAVNKATDMHRVKSRTQRALTSFEEMLAPLRPSAPRPGRDLEETERMQALRDGVTSCLEKINPRYARAIELRFMQDKSRQECAEELEVKLGTFDVLLLRALRAFRKEWEDLFGAGAEAREQA
ncbi:MAG: sigma-70 family RNA polymerase sigma factor [Sandaracinaceae bacterium]|nr:sigma-70 family RNA polymerase sigma factor [Sandaracinaceae bacterium]